MRLSLTTAVFLALIPVEPLQAQEGPDFSGAWVLFSSSSGAPEAEVTRLLQIDQDDSLLTVTDTVDSRRSRSYRLDGAEASEETGGIRRVFRIQWVTNALVITTDHIADDGRNWQDMKSYSLDHRTGNLSVFTLSTRQTREPVMGAWLAHYVRAPE